MVFPGHPTMAGIARLTRVAAPITATSKPMTTGSAPSNPRCQVNRAMSWWASTAPPRLKTNPPRDLPDAVAVISVSSRFLG
jgi:hypothetical protein